MKKQLFSVLSLFLLCFGAMAQITLINPSGDGGFENGTTFSANNWTAINHSSGARSWYVGNGVSGYSGNRAAFIGDNSSSTSVSTATRVVHFYKSVTIPSGAQNIVLSFKYLQSYGDPGYDFTGVFLNGNIPVSGVQETTGALVYLDPGFASANNYSVFTTVSVTVPNTYAGTTNNLIFSFTCDAAAPQSYAAIDNVSLTYSSPTCAAANIPYTQDFESVTVPAIPVCNSVQNLGAGGNTWITYSNPGYGFTSKNLAYSYNSFYAANSWFYTQGLNLTGGVTYKLTYKYGNNSTIYPEKLKVSYGTSATSSSMIYSLSNHPNINGGNPTTYSVNFTPSSSGVYYIGFNVYSDVNMNELYLDDISVIVAPAICNAANIPYTQNFESVTTPAIPTCNSVQNLGNGNVWETTNNPGAGFTSKTLTYTYNLNYAANTWYYTQGLNLTGGVTYRLTYKYGNASSATYYESLKVNYGTAANSSAMTTTLSNHPNILNGTSAITHTVDFTPSSSGVYYIGYHAYSPTNMNKLYVDDISVIVAPAICNAANIPYTQDFESVTTPAIPTCNSVQNLGNGNVWETTNNPGAGFTSKTLTYTYNLNYAANTWYYTQGLNLTGGVTYRLTYKYGNASSATYYESLKVNYGTAANSSAMTTTLSNHPNILNGTSAITHTVDFTPSSSGVYYIGYHAYSPTNMNKLYVDDISVIVAPSTCAAASIPYTQNFESVTTPAIPTCNSVQNLGNGNIWETANVFDNGFSSNVLKYAYNGVNAANTWYYTQGLNLTGGISYRLSYKYGNNSASTFTESLNVNYGLSPNSSSMNNVLTDHPSIHNMSATIKTVDFTPSASGVYYIGFHVYSDADQYYLYVDDINVALSPTTDISELSSALVNLFPNPNNGIVTILIGSEFINNSSIEVYDALGKLVIEEALVKEMTTVNTSKLDNGIYFYKIISNKQDVKVGRMIKQ